MSVRKDLSALIILPFGFKMGNMGSQKVCHQCSRFFEGNLRLFYRNPEAVRMPYVDLMRSENRVPIGGSREERFFCASCCENVAIKAF